MDENDKILKKILDKVEENNDIIKNLQSAMRWGRFFRIFYWVIIVGMMFGAYYFTQPYIENLLNVYSGFQNLSDGFPNIELGNLLGR